MSLAAFSGFFLKSILYRQVPSAAAGVYFRPSMVRALSSLMSMISSFRIPRMPLAPP